MSSSISIFCWHDMWHALSTKPSLNHCVEELQASKLSETPGWRVLTLSRIVLFLLLKRYLSSYYDYIFIQIYNIQMTFGSALRISCVHDITRCQQEYSEGLGPAPNWSLRHSWDFALSFSWPGQMCPSMGFDRSRIGHTRYQCILMGKWAHMDRNANARAAHGNRMGLY